jgi:glycerophosphoryl diester phosphodiesterase
MVYIIIAAVPTALFALFVFAVMTRRKMKDAMTPFEERLIAHRGLHTPDAPENSLAAFKRAKDAGYGIELDVQLTSDGRLAVFHDETLKRMCGVDKKLSELTLSELEKLPLGDTDCKIPLFEEVLRLIDGRVPMVIEIKSYGNALDVCRVLAGYLDGYGGDFCIESFDPFALRWFRKNRPSYVRGQLAKNYLREGTLITFPVRLALTYLFADVIGRPDFIAYNHKNRKTLAMRFLKRTGSAKFAAWTVRSEKELSLAKKFYDIIIFDSFVPGEDTTENKK